MKQKFILATIIPKTKTEDEVILELEELGKLVESLGGEVVAVVAQNREIHDKGLYLGDGKIKEIGALIEDKDVDVVVLNGIIKPGHIFDMHRALEKYKRTIDIWDRVDLILNIFAAHAQTKEAKLQIELASMRHMGPRIYGMGMVMSRQGGGIGTRGVGETNTELMKRHWRDQMKQTKDKLAKLAREREQQFARREKNSLKTVSLVGYTNAGKTSLFNTLTKKQKLAEDVLFATLDSAVGKLAAPYPEDILISDTIGFIQNLPAELIEAFKSTLMETIHADVLLHVIDVSDPELYTKIRVVDGIIKDLGIGNKKQIYVFNKIDQKSQFTKFELEKEFKDYSPQFISVVKNEGITDLIDFLHKEVTS